MKNPPEISLPDNEIRFFSVMTTWDKTEFYAIIEGKGCAMFKMDDMGTVYSPADHMARILNCDPYDITLRMLAPYYNAARRVIDLFNAISFN